MTIVAVGSCHDSGTKSDFLLVVATRTSSLRPRPPRQIVAQKDSWIVSTFSYSWMFFHLPPLPPCLKRMISTTSEDESDPNWIQAENLEEIVGSGDDTNEISCSPVQSSPCCASPLSSSKLVWHNSPLTIERIATTSPRQSNPQVHSPLSPQHQLSSCDDSTTVTDLSPAVPPPLIVSHLQTPPPSIRTPDIRGSYNPGSNDLSCEMMEKGWLNSNEETHQFSKRHHYNAAVAARRTLQTRTLSLT